jgi:hypothetical protein
LFARRKEARLAKTSSASIFFLGKLFGFIYVGIKNFEDLVCIYKFCSISATSFSLSKLIFLRIHRCAPKVKAWEYEQPYVDHLLLNARTFDRRIAQLDFEHWHALDRDNTHIWDTYYQPKPLYHSWKTWQEWLPAYRQLITPLLCFAISDAHVILLGPTCSFG